MKRIRWTLVLFALLAAPLAMPAVDAATRSDRGSKQTKQTQVQRSERKSRAEADRTQSQSNSRKAVRERSGGERAKSEGTVKQEKAEKREQAAKPSADRKRVSRSRSERGRDVARNERTAPAPRVNREQRAERAREATREARTVRQPQTNREQRANENRGARVERGGSPRSTESRETSSAVIRDRGREAGQASRESSSSRARPQVRSQERTPAARPEGLRERLREALRREGRDDRQVFIDRQNRDSRREEFRRNHSIDGGRGDRPDGRNDRWDGGRGHGSDFRDRFHLSRTLRSLPHRHEVVKVYGHDYYFCDGLFYGHFGNGYRLVRAPIGAHISVLPYGHRIFVHGGVTFYIHLGTFFRFDPIVHTYVVVEPPADAYYKDILYLRDGEIMEGHLLRNDGDTVDFLMDGEIYEIPLYEVEAIEFGEDYYDYDGEYYYY